MADKTEAKITLHWLNGSRAQRILWLLVELDVPYELKIYHRTNVGLAPPELKQVWPLGKSPVLTILPPGAPADQAPIVLAESGAIVEYLCSHYARPGSPMATLLPPQWKAGHEGEIGGETAAYLRFRHLMHFAEGTLMTHILVLLILTLLKGPRVPFIFRFFTGFVANKVISAFVAPNLRSEMALMETYLAEPPTDGAPGETSSSGSGKNYLCGDDLTGADILLSFPLLALKNRGDALGPWEAGSMAKQYPKLFAYLDRIVEEPGYVEAVKRIEKVDGKYSVILV